MRNKIADPELILNSIVHLDRTFIPLRLFVTNLKDGDSVEHDDDEAGEVGEREEDVDEEERLQHPATLQVSCTKLF